MPKNDIGRQFERWLERRLGAARNAMSGAGSLKGDMVVGPFLLEAKATESSQITVRTRWLEKIEGEAVKSGRWPALVLGFWPVRQAWVLIPLPIFEMVVQILEQEERREEQV